MDLFLSIPREVPGLGFVGIYPGLLINDIDQDGRQELLVPKYSDKAVEIYHVFDGEPSWPAG
jgi:hypothetical protein